MTSPVGKLFIMELSPPCRAVMLTAAALDIKLELVETNLFKGEHLTPEFLKLNPSHSTPTYVDNDGTSIGDSHAIMAYLVSKYGKDDSLYPKDLAKRSAVDQRLHFDSGSVYAIHRFIVGPMYGKKATGPNEDCLERANNMYKTLDAFLDGNNWVAGTATPTIADFSVFTSISCISIVAPFDKAVFGNIENWMKRCQALHYHDVNIKGQKIYASMLRDMLNNKHDFLAEFCK